MLARAGSMSWSSLRGKERESKTYHEPELHKNSHDRTNEREPQGTWVGEADDL